MIIDVNTCFGRSPRRRVRYADGVSRARMCQTPAMLPEARQDVDWSLDNLLRLIDEKEVARALTYSLRGRLYDFVSGNDETLRAADEHTQLAAVATIDPRRHFGCMEEVDKCAETGFVGFRFFPGEQGWAIDSLPFLRLCERIAEHGLPIMLPAGGWGEQTRIARLIGDFGVPIVAMGATFDVSAESIAVASSCQSFHCETSLMHTVETIEGLAGEAGAEKLVFGSNIPESYFDAAFGLVDVARLRAEARTAVLCGNAGRLFMRGGRG